MLFIDIQMLENKYTKDYDKYKESLLLKYWGVNIFNGGTMSENFLKMVIGGLKKYLSLIKV